MEKLPGHKERSLAWLRGLEEASKAWKEVEQVEPKPRMTAVSVNEKYYRELINAELLYRVNDDIHQLVRDMYMTPDAIIPHDAEALTALIAIRINCEDVINGKRGSGRD